MRCAESCIRQMPFENNIYLLHNDLTVFIIAELSGSCIYGCQWKDRYVFSTVIVMEEMKRCDVIWLQAAVFK